MALDVGLLVATVATLRAAESGWFAALVLHVPHHRRFFRVRFVTVSAHKLLELVHDKIGNGRAYN